MLHSRQHSFFTVAAVFLLLFTALDLAYPQMCAEEGDNSFVASRGALAMEGITAPGAASTDPISPHADDCFCCCAHVLVGPIFHVPMPGGITQERFLVMAQRVSVPVPPAFRPPRLA